MTAAHEITLQARGVKKTYGTGALAYEALRGVDFEARAGEIVMLSGPSGSGKTTLVSILGCVLRPTEGEVRIFDELVSSRPESALPDLRLRYVGFIFQGANLIASLDARENVALPLRLRGYGTRGAHDEANRLLTRVGLTEHAHKRPAQLSGGQRQRVAVARAVAGAPPIVLADEPTASLDAEAGAAITGLLKELAVERGHTVVLVTHDERIAHLANRVVHIEDGRIAEPPGRHEEKRSTS